MQWYVVRRLLAIVPVLFGVSLFVFLMLKLVPGDIALLIAGPQATADDIRLIREALGLDQPIWVQYFKWLGRALQGDLGTSIGQGKPVLGLVMSKFQNTLILTGAGVIVSVTLGIVAGVISATKQYSLFDRAAMLIALFGNSMPVFWLGMMLVVVFSLKLGWFPASGMYDVRGNGGLVDLLKHLALPALTLGLVSAGIVARMTRSSMLEVIRQDYIRTARAKGLPQLKVVVKHALKNALLPVLTIVGLQVGFLLGGAVLTETVFAWPGVGTLLFTAITQRDIPLVQGAVLLVATTFVFINLAVDLLYATVDPRIRYE